LQIGRKSDFCAIKYQVWRNCPMHPSTYLDGVVFATEFWLVQLLCTGFWGDVQHETLSALVVRCLRIMRDQAARSAVGHLRCLDSGRFLGVATNFSGAIEPP